MTGWFLKRRTVDTLSWKVEPQSLFGSFWTWLGEKRVHSTRRHIDLQSYHVCLTTTNSFDLICIQAFIYLWSLLKHGDETPDSWKFIKCATASKVSPKCRTEVNRAYAVIDSGRNYGVHHSCQTCKIIFIISSLVNSHFANFAVHLDGQLLRYSLKTELNLPGTCKNVSKCNRKHL